MTTLSYVGPGQAVRPLPEGWPAGTHEDDDEDRVALKLASGDYAIWQEGDAKPVDPLDNDWPNGPAAPDPGLLDE